MTNPNEQFDNEAKLTAYVLGELDGDEAAILERQLESDASLRQAVDAIRQTADLVGAELHAEPALSLTDTQRAEIQRDAASAPEAEPPAPVIFTMRRVWIGTGLAAAACITLAILVPLTMQSGRLQSSADVAIAGKPANDLPPTIMPKDGRMASDDTARGKRRDADEISGQRAGEQTEWVTLEYGRARMAETAGEPDIARDAINQVAAAEIEDTLRRSATMAGGPSGGASIGAARVLGGDDKGVTATSAERPARPRPTAQSPAPPVPSVASRGAGGGIGGGGGPLSNQDAGARKGPALLGDIPLLDGAFERQQPAEAEAGEEQFSSIAKFGSDAERTLDDRDGNPDREGYDAISDNPFIRPTDQPLSTLSIDVDTAAYSNVRRFIHTGHRPPKDAVRIEELVNYFRYDDPAPDPKGDEPFAVNVEVGPAPWKAEHRLVRLGIRGRDIDRDMRPATNLVFLIDVSGSMNNANKLPLVQQSMRMLVNHLTPDDRVALAVYSGNAGLVLPSTYCHDKQTILNAIGQLRAGGSTAGGAGIQLAYKVAVENFIEGGVNRVILCTDGDFNVGVSSDGELVRLIEGQRKTGVFLSVLGFGQGNFQDAKMEKITNAGNGNFYYIDTLDEAKKVLVEEMTGTLVTIAKDVKIQVDFNPRNVNAYRLIGYENRKLAARDFADDTKDAGEIGAGHSLTVLYEIIPADVAFDDPQVEPSKYAEAGTDSATPADDADADEFNHELLEVRMRFKQPDSDTSVERRYPVIDEEKPLESTSADYRFASSVAAFGMILRDSPHMGDATFDAVLALARGSIGEQVTMDEAGKYLEDFVHFTLIARPEMAAANANALLNSGLTDAQLLQLSESGPVNRDRIDRALGRASKIESTNAAAVELNARLQRAVLADPKPIKPDAPDNHRRGFITLVEQASQIVTH